MHMLEPHSVYVSCPEYSPKVCYLNPTLTFLSVGVFIGVALGSPGINTADSESLTQVVCLMLFICNTINTWQMCTKSRIQSSYANSV